jgi:hypothetical protein
MARLIGLVAVLFVAAACGQASGRSALRSHPDDQQARADLANIVALAKSGDFSGLCGHGSANCEWNLENLGARSTVPLSDPLVVGSRDVADDGDSQGGRLLEVCGLDGAGTAYRSSLLLFGAGGDFTAIEALYWTSITYTESHLAEASVETKSGPEWAGCPSGK